MRKIKTKLIIAAALILLGAIIFASTMTALSWDFRKLSTMKMQTKDYEITQDFNDINITSRTADVVFAASNDGTCKVVCYEEVKMTHTVGVENGALTIAVKDEKTWIDYIGLNFYTPKITVYLPADEYGAINIDNSTGHVSLPDSFKFNCIDIEVTTGHVECRASASDAIKIKATTGHIDLANLSANSVNLSLSSGNTEISNVKCNTLTASSTTGDVTLDDVIVGGKLSVKCTTGDVELEDSDAGEIWIKTNTGDVEGSLLSEKTFITHTTTGDVDVPRNTTGGVCEITTTTGDIEISIKSK